MLDRQKDSDQPEKIFFYSGWRTNEETFNVAHIHAREGGGWGGGDQMTANFQNA